MHEKLMPVTEDFIAEETAWSLIEQNKWIPTPQLLFALKAYVHEVMAKKRNDRNRNSEAPAQAGQAKS